MLCYYIRIDYAFFTSGFHHAQTSLAHGAARERRGPVGGAVDPAGNQLHFQRSRQSAAAHGTASAGLAARNPAAGEPGAATAGAGKPIDGGPADPTVIAHPGFAVGSDPGEECQLPVATVGLRPIALARPFEAAQVDRTADGVDAVSIAVRIHTGQQVGAASAGGKARDLRPGVYGEQQRNAHQR